MCTSPCHSARLTSTLVTDTPTHSRWAQVVPQNRLPFDVAAERRQALSQVSHTLFKCIYSHREAAWRTAVVREYSETVGLLTLHFPFHDRPIVMLVIQSAAAHWALHWNLPFVTKVIEAHTGACLSRDLQRHSTSMFGPSSAAHVENRGQKNSEHVSQLGPPGLYVDLVLGRSHRHCVTFVRDLWTSKSLCFAAIPTEVAT